MIKHILTLLWNKKGRNSMMIMEIALSFLVLFGVLTFIIESGRAYQQPRGFDTENIYVVSLPFDDHIDSLTRLEHHRMLRQTLTANEEVESMSFSSMLTPFSGWASSSGDDSHGFLIRSYISDTDENYAQTMGLNLTQGRWFKEEDLDAKYPPIVVTQQFIDNHFPGKVMLDSVIQFNGEYMIKGVIDNYKYMGEFESEPVMTFFYQPLGHEMNDAIFLRVSPNTPATFESKVNKQIAGILKDNNFIIESLDVRRQQTSKDKWLLIIALLSVSIFLVINVALGLFGVLWQSINNRRGEIGLRKALGAYNGSISWQITLETLFLTAMGLLIGSFFAIQFPLLEVFEIEIINYFYAFVIATVFILLLVLFCALYPSSQAAKIQPAIALHEE